MLKHPRSGRFFAPFFSGGYGEEETPVPIPNTAVKLFRADGTAGATLWESRSPPGSNLKGPRVRSRAFLFAHRCGLFALTGADVCIPDSRHSGMVPVTGGERRSIVTKPETHQGNILVVEDEPDIAEILQFNLEKEGYAVSAVGDGAEALREIAASRPDLVVLDIMLPGLDGLEVCRRLRSRPETQDLPILVVSARGEEIDRVVGLELGVDDYVAKPFSPREVVLRVGAILRRTGDDGNPLRAGTIVVEPEAHRVIVGEGEVQLTATEFRLLQFLIQKPGRVRTREQLLDNVWGYNEDVDSRTIDTHIRRLRAKLGEEAGRVETVVGIGYRIRAD